MIIDNYIAEQFIDPTTAPWTPLTGITATITIWSVVNWVKTKIIDDASCTNDWEGYYSYLFTDMQPSTFYMYEIVPSATAYRVSGWIDYRMQNMSVDVATIRWGGGGFSINYGTIQNSIYNARDKIVEEMEKKKVETLDAISETNSHIDLAKEETIGKIDSIEIPEAKLEEKEAKKAIKLITSVDKKLTSYIASEMSEKDEISGIMQEFTRQEMEQMKAEKLKEDEKKNMELEEQKKEEELMKSIEEEVRAEFDKQDEMEKEEKKKELEAEIKEMEREMKEKEKELKSL